MAKKSKEIELGGLRIQLDPLVLLRRIVTRQKLVLVAVAVLGGIATALQYVRTPKKYTSFAEIVIRAEAFQEDYLRKLLNVVARYVGSDTEMMMVINELDLYADMRRSMPYELVLRDMRSRLKIDRPGSSLVISFQSKSPRDAQLVVAFVTERVMTKLADLKDSPYRQQLDAISTGMADVEPRLEGAQLRLFEFKQRHPEIAQRTIDLREGSPAAIIQEQLERTKKELEACFGGAVEVATAPKRSSTPACRRLDDAEAEREVMLGQFTASHPAVMALDNKISDLEAQCAKSGAGDRPAARGKMSETECAAAARAKLGRLSEERLALERGASKTPELERQWAELNLEASALDSEYSAFREAHRRVNKDRLVAANEFRDSFVLVDPPRVPEVPSHPEKGAFMLAGMVITAIVGLSLAILREALRQTFADAREVEAEAGVPVLVTLPALTRDR
ncbi:hypothetical protein L6R52_02335 [Myxococcota bacterium]|nr:hypothetical protein [Myxococcota bacterium]